MAKLATESHNVMNPAARGDSLYLLYFTNYFKVHVVTP